MTDPTPSRNGGDSGLAVAIAGGKGGVGKTTTSINLGAALVQRDNSVIVVEADLAMANLVDFLTLDLDIGTDPTLHEVLQGHVRLEAAIYEAPGGLHVLPSGVTIGGYQAADPTRLQAVIDSLTAEYDYVLIDTAAGLSEESLVPLMIADRVCLVASPRVSAVRDGKKTKELAERFDGAVLGVIFTRSGTGSAPPIDRIASFIGVDLLGHVPDDESVPLAQDAGMPVVNYRPGAPAAVRYWEIAETIDSTLSASSASVFDLEKRDSESITGQRNEGFSAQ